MSAIDILAEIRADHIRKESRRWANLSSVERGRRLLKWFIGVCEAGPEGYLAEIGQYAAMEGLRRRGLVTVEDVEHKHGRRLVRLTPAGRVRSEELADLLKRPSL